jgi:phosphatidylserine/phosphatidylglycerophosphate/cardiolipin synthase-like enzyme
MPASSYVKPYFSKTSGRYYKDGVDTKIISDISEATQSVKMAMYYLTNKKITKALIKAHQRGVDVKVFTDDKKVNSKKYKQLKKAGIIIKDDKNKKALMHNKILIIDNEIVWISSANYTVYSFYRNHDNFLRIKDKTIVSYYDSKFTKIYHNDKSITKAYISKDKNIEIYFSPDTNFEKRVISLIKNAKISVDFLAFAFTNPKIADAMISAKKRGLKVKGVFDKAQNSYQKYSKYKYLKKNGIDVKLDKNKFKLHSKVIIIDKKIVISGSYNFTKQANSKNDENSIVIFDENIAKRYINNFNKIYNKR